MTEEYGMDTADGAGTSQMSRRIFGKTAAAMAAAAVPTLAGCGAGATPGGRTEITFACAKFFAQKTIGAIVDEYNAAQSRVFVKLRELPTPNQSTQVHQQLVRSLSQRDGDIDVYTADIVWIAEFAAAGWSARLDDAIPPATRAQYFSGAIDACTYRNELHALPWFLDAGMLYYRKDLLEAAGLAVPAHWDELATAARRLMDSGAVTNGFNWQGRQQEVLVCNLVEFIGSNGGSILGTDGRTVTIDDPAAVTAVQFMVDTFATRKITSRDVLSWDEVPSELPFLGGRTAFLRNWSFVWNDVQNPSASAVVGKVAATKLPSFPGGSSTACLGGYQLGMNAASSKKSAALDFLTWMSSPATQLTCATQLGLAPSRPAVYAEPDLARANPFMVSLREVFMTGAPRPRMPKYAQISLAVQAGVSAALASGDVAPGLRAARDRIAAIIG
ncbi:ABC transporter substrate-binding protein [Nocardia vaccinii]|uniref:ABC transporter substrate-binding protein n=1 Tax=Nocardia vaccinii TaxID=1822 RepID=UPI000837663F|nr:ABC transporter substrate-binding protein [Nocardia vaccinii]